MDKWNLWTEEHKHLNGQTKFTNGYEANKWIQLKVFLFIMAAIEFPTRGHVTYAGVSNVLTSFPGGLVFQGYLKSIKWDFSSQD